VVVHEGLHQVLPVGDGFAVDGADDVAGAKAGGEGGAGRFGAVGEPSEGFRDVADAGGGGHRCSQGRRWR